MDFPRSYSLQELARWLNCDFRGPEDHAVLGMNEIHRVRPGDLVFVDHPKYYDTALQSAATTVLLDQEVEVPKGKALLISPEPFRDFNRLSTFFQPFRPLEQQIDPSAQIGEGSVLGPQTVVGRQVKIGRNCRIGAHVFIGDHTEIGDDVVVQANTVLGSDAFYYKKRPEGYDPLLSTGKVVLEDKVHIGAGCTIDRGVSDETRLGYGTKIDNLVQIGHDTRLGAHCLLASQVGIAGCTILEDEVVLWGQVGVSSGITIGKGAVVLAQSGISKDLEGGHSYFGYPAGEARTKYRELAAIRELPGLIRKLRKS